MAGEPQEHFRMVLRPDLVAMARHYGLVQRELQRGIAQSVNPLILSGGTHEGGRRCNVLPRRLESEARQRGVDVVFCEDESRVPSGHVGENVPVTPCIAAKVVPGDLNRKTLGVQRMRPLAGCHDRYLLRVLGVVS